jgi:hypothetical protein
MNDIRWIIATWLIDLAITVAPNGESKISLLRAIEPWLQSEVSTAKKQDGAAQ